MDEKIFDKVREMERNLTFYEHAIGVLTCSLAKGTMQAIVMNGSYEAKKLVKELNDEVKKIVEQKREGLNIKLSEAGMIDECEVTRLS